MLGLAVTLHKCTSSCGNVNSYFHILLATRKKQVASSRGLSATEVYPTAMTAPVFSGSRQGEWTDGVLGKLSEAGFFQGQLDLSRNLGIVDGRRNGIVPPVGDVSDRSPKNFSGAGLG